MKIIVLGFSKIKYMPYLNLYLESIDTKENDVHLVYWNRDLKNEKLDSVRNLKLHEFKVCQQDDKPKRSKISSFIKYRKFVLKTLKDEKFDFIIFLHSLPGVLIFDKLLKNFNDRFIFDFRDITYEHIFLYKFIINQLVSKSKVTFISSEGFRKVLFSKFTKKTYITHNLDIGSIKKNNNKSIIESNSRKIRIGFWGFIRNESLNITIINKISNDKRFELHYYGKEQQTVLNLKEYVNKINADNIFFHGEYNPEEKYKFIYQTDIIHNIYNDNNMNFAISNKYYDGIIYKIPQLCFEKSFMADKALNTKIGLPCNPENSNFTSVIYDYFISINHKEFIESCDKELNKVYSEYKKSREIIRLCIDK